jgi:hypothetical protein
VDVDFVDEHTRIQESAIRIQNSSDSRFLIPDSFLFYGDDGDLPAVLAVIFEADLAIDLGEQGVVLAQADVEAWFEAAPLLTDENRSAGDEVAVVTLDAETLRIAVSTVA